MRALLVSLLLVTALAATLPFCAQAQVIPPQPAGGSIWPPNPNLPIVSPPTVATPKPG
jgi:hypothetical protein